VVAVVVVLVISAVLIYIFVWRKRSDSGGLFSSDMELTSGGGGGGGGGGGYEEFFGLTGNSMAKWNANEDRSYRMRLEPGSKQYDMVMGLFKTLDGEPLINSISAVYGVINPQVATNFRGHRGILKRRFKTDPHLFKKEDWTDGSTLNLRQWVMHHFISISQSYPWNGFNEEVPVVPMVHGTDAKIAWKIVDTGFSALSSLDAGFYGSGIYFTSSAQYALPYYSVKPTPAIIICMTIPGNVYPVIEARTDPNSMFGMPIKSGCQSHYVLTTKDGNPCRQRMAPRTYYDELVLSQEAQAVPVAIIEFNQASLARLASAFQRVVADTSRQSRVVYQ